MFSEAQLSWKKECITVYALAHCLGNTLERTANHCQSILELDCHTYAHLSNQFVVSGCLSIKDSFKIRDEPAHTRVSNGWFVVRAETCSKFRRVPCDKSRVPVLNISCSPRENLPSMHHQRGRKVTQSRGARQILLR